MVLTKVEISKLKNLEKPCNPSEATRIVFHQNLEHGTITVTNLVRN